jgi:hypothetical protein
MPRLITAEYVRICNAREVAPAAFAFPTPLTINLNRAESRPTIHGEGGAAAVGNARTTAAASAGAATTRRMGLGRGITRGEEMGTGGVEPADPNNRMGEEGPREAILGAPIGSTPPEPGSVR